MFGRGDTTNRDAESSSDLGVGFYAAATLMGVVAVALVAVLVVAANRHDTPLAVVVPGPSATTAPPPVNGSTTVGGPPPAQAGRPPGCATTGTDQTVPFTTPTGITWTLVQRMATPASVADGPALHTPSGVGYCYSRTPVGAVLAASNLGRTTGGAQQAQDDQLKFSTVPGPLADQIAARPAVVPSPGASAGAQLAGFRVLSYSPTNASIALVVSAAAHPGTYGVATAALEWNQGDWRVVVQPGPDILVTTTTTTSLLDYIPWSGVS